MKEKILSGIYRMIKWLVRICYPQIEVVGAENLPKEPAIIVGNHAKMNGPIACELYFPTERYTWCAGEMMHLKDVPAYAYQDFWSGKPGAVRWFYKLLSYIIAPLSVCVFNQANTIGVYHDTRIVSTFKNTVKRLEEGASIVIFPEHDVPHNHIVCEFQDRFIDVAKLYYKRTGQALAFVPLYIAPSLKKMYLGKPVRFCPENPIQQERQRICEYLMAEITAIACSLPLHIVVPYQNMPKKNYSTNTLRKTAVVDYRTFRLSKLNDPQFSHLKLLLGWVGYFILFFLTENLIPAEKCYPVHCWIDDVIPFNEIFLIPYVFWYVLIVISLLYFLLYDVESFKSLQTYIIITQVVAMAVYIIFPSRQDLRPLVFPRDNFLTRCVSFLYTVDTNTGVCPSLHVAYSLGIASVWLRNKTLSRRWRLPWKVFVVIAVILICLSTMFIKQHSAVDFFAALPVCLFAEMFVYGRKYWRGRAL